MYGSCLLIGCADNSNARKSMAACLPGSPNMWLIDAGNDTNWGQVLIGNTETKAEDTKTKAEDTKTGAEANDNPESESTADDDPNAPAAQIAPVSDASEGDLKIVISLRDGIATVGAQRSASDAHIASFARRDLASVIEDVLAVVERAKAKWDNQLLNPTFSQPKEPGRANANAAADSPPADPDGAPEKSQPTLF